MLGQGSLTEQGLRALHDYDNYFITLIARQADFDRLIHRLIQWLVAVTRSLGSKGLKPLVITTNSTALPP